MQRKSIKNMQKSVINLYGHVPKKIAVFCNGSRKGEAAKKHGEQIGLPRHCRERPVCRSETAANAKKMTDRPILCISGRNKHP